MFKKYKGLGQIFFVMSMALLMPNIAHAADLFSVPSGDLSKQLFLDILFPEDLGSSPLATLMLAFNSVALILGGILAAYTLIAGIMQTAHDGEMLGRKWSSMWLPIRMSIGTALLIPAAGGFCTAQVLVLWMITQGVGFADKMWTAYTVNDSKSIAIAATPSASNLNNLALQLLKNNYCVTVLNAQQEGFSSEDKYSGTNDKSVYQKYLDSSNTTQNIKEVHNFGKVGASTSWYKEVWDYFATTGASDAELAKACGTLAYNVSADNNNNTDLALTSKILDTEAFSINKVFGGTYSGLDSTGANSASPLLASFGVVYQAHATAVNKMNTEMQQVAENIFNGNSVDPNKDIASAIKEYQSSIKSSASSFSNNTTWSTFKDAMNAQGWLMAGSWYINIAKYQGLISQAANDLPQVTGFSVDKKIFNDEKFYGRMVDFLNKMEMINKNSPYAIMQIGKQVQGDANDIVNAQNGSESIFEKTFTLSGVVSSILNDLNGETSETDPLSVAIGVGNAINNFVGVTLAIVIAISFVMPAIGSAAIMILSPLFIFSVVLSVIIPFTPYIMWMGVIAGWMILCIEAMIGTPLWIVTHLHPDADGVVGKGGAGYGMVLSLTLRPSLMVLGLVCAMITMPILVNIVNVSFGPTFVSVASSTGGLGILQSIAILAVYTILMLTMVKKSFSLIHVIPDEIMKWLGVNVGTRMDSHANEAANAVVQSQAINQGMNVAGEVGRSITGLGRDLNGLDEKRKNIGERSFNQSSIGEGSYEHGEGAAEIATGLQGERSNDVNDSISDLNGMGKNDMTMKANQAYMDNFNKTYPDPNQVTDNDTLKEAKARSTILQAQMEQIRGGGSRDFGNAAKTGFNNAAAAAMARNGFKNEQIGRVYASRTSGKTNSSPGSSEFNGGGNPI